MLLEVAVDSIAGIAAAEEGGADRIELCAALSIGGLTPGPGLIARAAASPVPMMMLIRPMPGGFVYGAAELSACEADIAAARSAGLAGVVIGASLPGGRLDAAALARLARAAAGLELTLHRAFDLVPDVAEAVDLAVELGFSRILTSGGAPAAPDGLARLTEARAQAAGRLTIMPGGGIRPGNAGPLVRAGFTELHASCGTPLPPAPELERLGFLLPGAKATSATEIRALRAAIALHGQG